VAGLNSLAAFDRELSNGRIDQLPGSYACISEGRSQDGCAAGRGLAGVTSVAVSPDGKFVYVVAEPSQQNGTVAAFARVTGPVRLGLRLIGAPRRCVSKPFYVSLSESGTLPLRSLRLTLDGRVVEHSGQGQLTHRVDVRRLKRHRHTLTATAIDLAGDTHHVSRRFRRC
jgi:6-phosphogluconolactonase (cycloisomerase 2 family)